VYVDFIILRTNAGTSSGDETARENEWTQPTSWIAANVPAASSKSSLVTARASARAVTC
jgi:hypothetical protein